MQWLTGSRMYTIVQGDPVLGATQMTTTASSYRQRTTTAVLSRHASGGIASLPLREFSRQTMQYTTRLPRTLDAVPTDLNTTEAL